MCSGQTHRILIVDDNFHVREALRHLLELRIGWTVCAEAADGRDAIEKARSCSPCAVILDLSMPRMNGIEAAHLLAEIMPTIPLFLFTNFASKQLKQSFAKTAIRDVVAKSDFVGLLAAMEVALAA
jgi:DNA-binding NarL/FixJ family response regulator